MPRDFDPSVREHDAAPPARRGSRRDPVPVDPSYEEPDPYPPPSSRVMRDEHRPRRGTLPDRRMLRRDPIEPAGEDRPAAVVTEPAGDTVPAEREFVADTVAPQRDPASQPVPPVAAQTVEERVTAVTTAEAEPERIEPRAAVPSPEPVEVDVAPQRTETAAAAADVPAAGRDPEPVRTPARRRLPALPALEPAGGTGESATTESAPATAATGLELAVRPAADSGDALRAAAGVLGEPASQPAERSERALDKRSGRSGVASRSGGVREGEAARPRRPERTEGDRMERKRSRETTPDAEAEAARRGEPGERRRERPRADGEPGRERRAEGEPARERRNSDGEAGRERRAADGRERRGDPERDARRANGSEGRGRSTDADRVHLGGRAGTPGRARPARPEGEAGERPVRNRPVRDRRPERAATDERGRGGARKGKRDKITDPAEREAAAKRAAARRAAAKKKQSGPKLLDDTMRAKLEVTAREGNGIKAAWATFRLHTDDLRRRNFAARAERMEYGSFDEFDRTTAQLTDRGYIGAGGGRMNVIGRPVEYRATTAQVAGLWPWSVGAGAPLIGTPLGSHLHTGAPVCFDPMNWFMRGSFITAPSLFVLGLNGFGKSSLVRRIVLGGVAQGITPLVLADVKPDYRKLVELVGGQVIDLGYGHGKLNPLAAGVLGSIVPLLNELPELQTQVMQEMRARQVTLVAGLVELVRGARVRDFEETLISTALRILYREGSGFTPDQPPIIEDLLDVVVAGGDELQLDAGADNPEEYQEAIKGLRRSLRALTQGPFGAVFNGHTTTPIDTNSTAVCVDVSHIPNGDKKLKAAVMLACWADGFASVEAAHVLADADMGPQRYFQVVMDELWQVLGLGDFMVDRVDELTRLQRGIATSLIMISHTIKDLQALGSEAAIAKALGFLERARAKIFGALPAEEIARLDSTVPFTAAEEEMVTSWSAPQALTGEALKPGQQRPPAPGTGKFLLKIGEDRRPGIPFHMEFTLSERESGIHDTNQRFSEFTETTASRGSDEGSAV